MSLVCVQLLWHILMISKIGNCSPNKLPTNYKRPPGSPHFCNVFKWMCDAELLRQNTAKIGAKITETITPNCADIKNIDKSKECYMENKLLLVIKKLESGISGIVYLVNYNGTEYALKQYISKNYENRKSEYETELAFLSSLQLLSSVVRLFGSQNGKYPCILMEYIKNGDLHDFMNDYNIYDTNTIVNMSLQYLLDIGEVIQYLNEINMVHMDIKPGNILYNDNPFKFYLTDFAYVKDWNFGEPILAGTPVFFSPEQVAHAVYNIYSSANISCIDRYSMYVVLLNLIGYKCDVMEYKYTDILDSWSTILCKVGKAHLDAYIQFYHAFKDVKKNGAPKLFMDLYYPRHKLMIQILKLKRKMNPPTNYYDEIALKILELISYQYIRETVHIPFNRMTKFDIIDSMPIKCIDWNDWFQFLTK